MSTLAADPASHWQQLRASPLQAGRWLALAVDYRRQQLPWQLGYCARQAVRCEPTLRSRLEALDLGPWHDATAGDAQLGRPALPQTDTLIAEVSALLLRQAVAARFRHRRVWSRRSGQRALLAADLPRGLTFHGDFARLAFSIRRRDCRFSGLAFEQNLKDRQAEARCDAQLNHRRRGDECIGRVVKGRRRAVRRRRVILYNRVEKRFPLSYP